jgi:hypothetical protein
VSGFRKPYTLKRQNGSFVNGSWVATAPTDVAIMASVQPATAKDMKNLPEGRRTGAAYALYTDTEPLTTIDGDNDAGLDPRKADQITLFTDVFEVMSVSPWQNDVISHYRAVVAKIA